MIGKIVSYSLHAQGRMLLRGFSTVDVRSILTFGRHRPADAPPGSEQRAIASGFIRGRRAEVVYTESDRRVLVITVYWIEWPKEVVE